LSGRRKTKHHANSKRGGEKTADRIWKTAKQPGSGQNRHEERAAIKNVAYDCRSCQEPSAVSAPGRDGYPKS
jgi:hypothetical protein